MAKILPLLTAAVSVVCCSTLSAGSARAEGPSFEAPCHDAAFFRARLEALVGAEAALSAFSVRIAPTESGRFVLTVDGEAESGRSVEGATCEELVEAAAVILAVRIERAAGDPEEAPQAAGGAEAPADDELGADLAAPRPEPGPAEEAAERRESGAPSLDLPGWLRGFGVVAALGAALGAAPGLTGVVRGGFSYERARAYGELGFGYQVPRASAQVAGGAARVDGVGALALGCARAHRFVFPCAGVEIGRVRASGEGYAGAREDRVLSGGARAVLRVPVDVHPVFRLEFRVAGVVPFTRYEVRLRDGTLVYRQSPVSGALSAGFSVHFE